ncbi:MAG: hypothetical protein MK554_13975, partial [Planctomycetes bacterium]|nr:hypothetical protein [Planctomycetota bacterium]
MKFRQADNFQGFFGLIVLIPAMLLLCTLAGAQELDYGRDIRPVLSDSCFNCHGPDAKARKGKLYLGSRAAVLESGVLSDGEMLRRLQSDDPDERMPPPDSTRVL